MILKRCVNPQMPWLMSAIVLFLGVAALPADAQPLGQAISAAEPIPDWRPVEVVAVEGFDDLAVRLDGGEVRRAFLAGLRPIPPEVGFRPLGKEHVEDERTRIARKVMKRLASADLFARVVTEQEGKLGLSIDAFSHKRYGFEHVWDPRKYPYCNTGWGAYNFNLYFLDQGYTTFLDNIGDNEVADVFHEARRMIESNSSKSIVTIHAVEPRQNVHVIFYDDDFLWMARNYGDHRRPAGNTEPGFFVHSKAHGRWIEIHKISTHDGKFGTSRSDDPEAQKKLAKISVAWDFTPYRDKPHIELPLRTSGAIAFPDRIEYETKSERYKLRCFSKLKIESAETVLYIPRADLLAAFGKDESAGIDDAHAGNKVQRITVTRDLRWFLEFFPDGSARVQYGSSGGDNASVPKGSVDFNKLLTAARKLRVEMRPPNGTEVSIHQGGETTRSFFVSDDSLFRRTIESLEWRNQQSLSDRFLDLLKKYPIFPEE